MFKKSQPQTNPNLFDSWRDQLSDRKLDEIKTPEAWHNIFKSQITSNIDEAPFSVLYNSKTGRSNAPIRILVGMCILKEGHGWSDQQMYEQCRFNLLVMNALGLNNLGDEVPVESTWYLFRNRLYEHLVKTGEDLIGACFEQLTRDQARLYGVNGENLRMDSKLIGSNIVKSSRLELVIGCLQVFYKSLDDKQRNRIKENDLKELESLSGNKANRITYKMTSETQTEYLEKLGDMIVRLLDEFKDDNDVDGEIKLLERVLFEQYNIEKQQVEIKENKEIKSDSLQSVHDPDAAYRKKRNQKVQGYSLNVTETCNKAPLNLITDVRAGKCNQADVEFVEDGIKQSEKVVGPVENVFMDGAYNSPDHNMDDINLCFTGMAGDPGRFAFDWKENKLIITDTVTGIEYDTVLTPSGNYRIFFKKSKNAKPECRYFTPTAKQAYFRRKKVLDLPEEQRHLRSNIEATLFQLSFLTKNNKTRYRTLFKHQLWGHYRGLWINLRRIYLYLQKNHCPDPIKTGVIALSNHLIHVYNQILAIITPQVYQNRI